MAAISITAGCAACSIVYAIVQVGPNFRVRVEDHGRPVKGIRVEIGSLHDRGNRAVTHTDKNGFAFFRGVRPGSYQLSADHDAGTPDVAYLEVKLDGSADVTITLKWPSIVPVLVRSLKGTIRGPDYLPGQAQPRLSLELLDSTSGRRLKSLQTTDSGEFDFESAAPGLYFVRLKTGLGGWGEIGVEQVPVAVDPGAPADHLELDLGWTSCGMWYADQSKCPQSDLNIEQLSGQIVDSTGASIADAKILLFDPAGTLVEQLQGDRDGKFTSPRSLAGNYQLVVSSAGFTPLRRTVHAKPAADPTRISALTVQLGLMGSCSVANLQ